jgi:hypothetical protein
LSDHRAVADWLVFITFHVIFVPAFSGFVRADIFG